MYIANELRKNNIAEYLLYMWQIEDTIRAFGCSLPRIRREYIARFDYTDEQKDEEADWFGNLVRMMNEEGCREDSDDQDLPPLMEEGTPTQALHPFVVLFLACAHHPTIKHGGKAFPGRRGGKTTA